MPPLSACRWWPGASPQRPAKGALTYGLKRTEILSAQFNGVTLLVLALLIIYEGIHRLINPPHVGGTRRVGRGARRHRREPRRHLDLSQANRRSMNVEGAFQHIL